MTINQKRDDSIWTRDLDCEASRRIAKVITWLALAFLAFLAWILVS